MTSSAAAAVVSASVAATTQRFDRYVSNATCRLTEINEHLLCALCSGYLVDATTIIECLHTFCRSCIVRYLESSETCPVCDVPLHQTNPLLGIRADTTLQTLVYKLVPGVFKDEVKRRCTVINNAHADGKSSSIMDRLLKDVGDMTNGGTVYTADEQFSVCLQYAPSLASSASSSAAAAAAAASSASSLSSDSRYMRTSSKSTCALGKQDLFAECSYLLCPASVTIAHLKKLIRNKLELNSDLPLDLYHSSPDGRLDDVYTLADVAYITAWTSVKPLHFYYQVNAKRPIKKPSSASKESGDCKRKLAHGSKAEKLPGGACLKRIITNNRQNNVKTKGVVYCSSSSLHRLQAPKAVTKKLKSPPAGKCLEVQIPKGSATREAIFPMEKSPIKESEEKSDLKDICQRKRGDSDVPDGKVGKASAIEERNRIRSLRDFDSKQIVGVQTKSSSIELTETSEITEDIETIIPKQSSENNNTTTTPKQHQQQQLTPPNQKKSTSSSDCSPSADSALSPSRPETTTTVSQTADGSTSDAEGNAIDSASSPLPPSKRLKLMDATDRNLFAAINSMIVNSSSNDNVVSSSTSSSQMSTDDNNCSPTADNKTSVETQTMTTKLISRSSSSKKGNKLRSSKKDSAVIKSRTSKLADNTRTLPVPLPVPLSQPLSPSLARSPGSVVAPSVDTSSQSISMTAHTTVEVTAAAAEVQGSTSAGETLCAPICTSDKTGGGGCRGGGSSSSSSNLNLPQNVSNPKTTNVSSGSSANPASTTVSSISYGQGTAICAKNPDSQPSLMTPKASSGVTSQASPSVTSQVSPSMTSQVSPSMTSQASPGMTSSEASPSIMTSEASAGMTSLSSPSVTSQISPSMTSQASPSVTSQISPSMTSEACPSLTSPTLTSRAALTAKSPAQPTPIALSGQPRGSSITRTTVTSFGAPGVKSSVTPSAKSGDAKIASPSLPRQLDTRTIVAKNNDRSCNNSVTSAGQCPELGKDEAVKRGGTARRTVNTADTSLRFRNKDRCHGEIPVQSVNSGKSGTPATPCLSQSSPVRCSIPTRSPDTVHNNASSLVKPTFEFNACIAPPKTTNSLKSPPAYQKESTGTKVVPCRVLTAAEPTANIRDKVPPNVNTGALQQQQNPVTLNIICKGVSRPKEVVLQPTTPIVSANPSSVTPTAKAVLFKPYQITTPASHTASPKRTADVLTTTTTTNTMTTFQGNTHHYTATPTSFPLYPSFQYPKDQQQPVPVAAHQLDVSKAFCCMMSRDSPVLGGTPASCEGGGSKSGLSAAVHRTMSNIPLHSVIKVPTYTARKMPPPSPNKKSERKGSRSPRSETGSMATPVASVGAIRKPELGLGSEDALIQKALNPDNSIEGKLKDRPASEYIHQTLVPKGAQSIDNRDVAFKQSTIAKGTKDNNSSVGKVDKGWNQPRATTTTTASSSSSSSSALMVRSCLKLPLSCAADVLEKGDSSSSSSSSSSSISTSSNNQSALATHETVQKTPHTTKMRIDVSGPSPGPGPGLHPSPRPSSGLHPSPSPRPGPGSCPGPSSSGTDHHGHSPKPGQSGKSCPTDEISYTRAEADSGTSPGAISLSPPRSGSKDDVAPGGALSPNPHQSSSSGPGTSSSLRKKLVIDLERCSPRHGKSSGTTSCTTPSPSVSTSLLRCCSPSTTTISLAEGPPLPGQATPPPPPPPRLVISLPRCQVPTVAPTTTLLSPSGGGGGGPCLSKWSPTSSGMDYCNSPPTTKRLKLMCNGMTIYRTLESPGSRSPRRTTSTGGGGGGSSSRRSSPVSAPVIAPDCSPLGQPLLSRASSCKSPSSSSSSPPQSKSRRKSNTSASLLLTTTAGVEPKPVAGTSGGEPPPPVVVPSVDSPSTSPRSAPTTIAPLPNPKDNGLFTVMSPWKGGHDPRGSGSLSVVEAAVVVEEPLELTTKEVKERQKEREYARLLSSNQRPPSAFTT